MRNCDKKEPLLNYLCFTLHRLLIACGSMMVLELLAKVCRRIPHAYFPSSNSNLLLYDRNLRRRSWVVLITALWSVDRRGCLLPIGVYIARVFVYIPFSAAFREERKE